MGVGGRWIRPCSFWRSAREWATAWGIGRLLDEIARSARLAHCHAKAIPRFGTTGALRRCMSYPKRSVSRSDSFSPFATFVRENDDEVSALHAVSSSAILAASIDESEEFI